jgi:hypothetical protein
MVKKSLHQRRRFDEQDACLTEAIRQRKVVPVITGQ